MNKKVILLVSVALILGVFVATRNPTDNINDVANKDYTEYSLFDQVSASNDDLLFATNTFHATATATYRVK